MKRLVRRPPVSLGVAVIASAVVASVAVLGADEGHSARDMRLLSGAAWLSSSKVGQVTLLDGSSAEVSAQVQVSPAGNLMDVVQHGSTAYVVDQTEGTLRRVDGANFEASAPQKPIPDAHTGLTAIPGQDAVYTLDTQRGILATTDPRTLTRRGELQSLANKLSTGTAVVDDAGALWAVDTDTGDLTHIWHGTTSIRRKVTQPGPAMLTVANGHPVVVNSAERKVISLDRDTGRVERTLDLDLRRDDTIQVSGSAHTERLYVVIGRGALNICDLAQGRCDNAIPLNAGSELGAAVEAGNRVFVPDFTTGQVLIIDLSNFHIIAKPTVLSPAGRFQLLTRDGMVFYNDLNSERAGVIHLDGTISKAAKYDPANPAKGTTTPGKNPGPEQPKQPLPPSGPQQPDPNKPRQPDPNKPQQPDPNNPHPGDPPPPALEIKANPVTPVVNEVVTLKVISTPAATLSNVEWNFGDGGTGGGELTSHKWTTARPNPYNVSVTALANGKQVSASVNVTVTAKPTVPLMVTVFHGSTAGTGAITSTDGTVNCRDTCVYNVDPDDVFTLTPKPDSGSAAGPWGDDCTGAGSGPTCDLRMNGSGKNARYTFTKIPDTEQLTITAPSNGKIISDSLTKQKGVDIDCPGKCSATANKGITVEVFAIPDDGFDVGDWGGACAGHGGGSCTLTMDRPRSASVTFKPKPKARLTLNLHSDRGSTGIFGFGKVTGPGISCPTQGVANTCTFDITMGTTITLTAEPDPRADLNVNYLSAWGGACSGTNSKCNVTMNGNQTVDATFKADGGI